MKKNNNLRDFLIQSVLTAFLMTGLVACNYYQKNVKASENKADSAAGIKDSVTGANGTQADTTARNDDRKFLIKVANINLEEIQLGKMAQENSRSKNVKEFGKMMEEDHHKAMYDLSVLAKNKSITIPTALADNDEGDYKKLMNKTGSDFDQDYCTMMVDGHKDAISLFEKESATTKDNDIKQFADNTLPTLHKHLDHATTCLASCKKM